MTPYAPGPAEADAHIAGRIADTPENLVRWIMDPPRR